MNSAPIRNTSPDALLQTQPRMQDLAAEFIASNTAPGVAYAIVKDGAIVFSGGAGVERVDGEQPDSASVFRIASMTKSFTAAAILLLRDRGLLRLDDTSDSHIPELHDMALIE